MSCPYCYSNECKCGQKQDEQIKILNSYPEIIGEAPANAEPVGLDRNLDSYPEDHLPDTHQYRRERDRLRREKKG